MPKTSRPVDKEELISAINQAESKEKFSNLSAMHKVAAGVYNKNNADNPITPAIVNSRIKEWKITVKTQPGKVRNGGVEQYSPEKLQAAIDRAEKDGPLLTMGKLAEKAATFYNSMDVEKEITFSVVLLRIKEFGLTVKTKPGKRGVQKGGDNSALVAARAARKGGGRAGKLLKHPQFEVWLKSVIKMCKDHGQEEQMSSLIKKASRGSLRAIIKLNCIVCCGFSKKEVKLCTCPACPMWLVRPYQEKDIADEDVADEVEHELNEDAEPVYVEEE